MRKLLFTGVLVCLLAAGCAKPYTLGFPGPLPVEKYLVDYEPGIGITVFYPDTEPPTRDAPLVIFSTGWNQPRASRRHA